MKFGRQVMHGKWLQVQELSLGCSTLPEPPELKKELFLPPVIRQRRECVFGVWVCVCNSWGGGMDLGCAC